MRPDCLFIIAQLINRAYSEQSPGSQMHKNCLMEIGLKTLTNQSKVAQARIINRKGVQARRARINDGLGEQARKVGINDG